MFTVSASRCSGSMELEQLSFYKWLVALVAQTSKHLSCCAVSSTLRNGNQNCNHCTQNAKNYCQCILLTDASSFGPIASGIG